MLTQVEITNSQGLTLILPIEDTSAGYLIKDIQGLDPVTAEIVSSPFANLDGEQEQSSRRGKRNIIFKLGYTTQAIRELRRKLYGFFMPKSKIRLRFYMEELDMFFVEINGTVESCLSPLFVKDPEATISILCVNPDFYEVDEVSWHFNSTSGGTYSQVVYEGDVDTGYTLTMDVDRTLTNITLWYRTDLNGDVNSMVLNFPTALAAGDTLTISTVSGSKGIYRTRSGSKTSILYSLDPASGWASLFQGINYVRMSSGGAPIPYTIAYTNKYGGL